MRAVGVNPTHGARAGGHGHGKHHPHGKRAGGKCSAHRAAAIPDHEFSAEVEGAIKADVR